MEVIYNPHSSSGGGGGSATAANQLLEIADLDILIKNTVQSGFTNLEEVISRITGQVVSPGGASLQDVYGVLGNLLINQRYLSGFSNVSIVNNTNSIYTRTLSGEQAPNSMALYIPQNVGATGTLDIEVNYGGGFIRIPATNLQATILGALVNPPYNVANVTPVIYRFDLGNVTSVRITPSVLSSSYLYTVSFNFK